MQRGKQLMVDGACGMTAVVEISCFEWSGIELWRVMVFGAC